jgi:hypothetical protein
VKDICVPVSFQAIYFSKPSGHPTKIILLPVKISNHFEFRVILIARDFKAGEVRQLDNEQRLDLIKALTAQFPMLLLPDVYYRLPDGPGAMYLKDTLWLYDEGARHRCGQYLSYDVMDFGNHSSSGAFACVGEPFDVNNIWAQMKNQPQCKAAPVSVN